MKVQFTKMTQTIEEEVVWKIYPDYPFLQANQFGEIRTKDRIVTRSDGRKQFVKGRILKQQLNPRGYMYVHFSVNGKGVNLRVHRIVATCFIPNPNNYPEVNHIDCDRTNNAVSNLEWCSSEYNAIHREKYGIALNHHVVAINLETLDVYWFESQSYAARQLGVIRQSIYKVANGKMNKTGGYWFCYADNNAIEKTRVKFGDEIAKEVEKILI